MARSYSESRGEGRCNEGPDEERAVGGRRIRVLLSSGKPMNAARTIPVKDVPIETLKAGKAELDAAEAEEKAKIQDPETTGSSSSGQDLNITSAEDSSRPSTSDVQRVDFEEMNGAAGDPITVSPVQERPGRDIRFGDLPHPRKHERQNSEANSYENAIDDRDEDESGRRTNTLENTGEQARGRVLRRATSSRLLHPSTFERILSNTFRRRRRSGSPSSRRSSQSNMTLPYFTFTPTIGRNSVILSLRWR